MFHFISGLPRSGSTLLSAILRQNPEVHTPIISPVGSLVGAVLNETSASHEGVAFFTPAQLRRRPVPRGRRRLRPGQRPDRARQNVSTALKIGDMTVRGMRPVLRSHLTQSSLTLQAERAPTPPADLRAACNMSTTPRDIASLPTRLGTGTMSGATTGMNVDGTLARPLAFLDFPPDPTCARFHELDGRVRTVSRAEMRQPINARGFGR